MFWQQWFQLLVRHMEDILSGIIYYSQKDKIPVSVEEWFKILLPLKNQYFHFLFWMQENEKKHTLFAINQVICNLNDTGIIDSLRGTVNRREVMLAVENSHGLNCLEQGLIDLTGQIQWEKQ
jgi:hypothetical protein